jgi:hypothetical protein
MMRYRFIRASWSSVVDVAAEVTVWTTGRSLLRATHPL